MLNDHTFPSLEGRTALGIIKSERQTNKESDITAVLMFK